MIRIGRNLIGARGLVTALAVLSLLPAGCSKTQSTQEAVDAQLKALNQPKANLAKFAGKVTVDGQPPVLQKGKALLVMLYDQKNPENNKHMLYSVCKKDGSFEFYRYVAGDGAPVGSYVVLFAELGASRQKGLVQPDALMNLYDDPDKNAQNKDFVIELAAPGKSNYVFNLELAGKEAVTTPGPHAITEIRKD
jgi:hypothetical protein